MISRKKVLKLPEAHIFMKILIKSQYSFTLQFKY